MRVGLGRSIGTVILLAILQWPGPGATLGQDAATKTAASTVDPRFRSPRATVRTFLIAMNLAADEPARIDEASACLDLAGLPPDRADGGRLASTLETIFRSTNLPTIVIPDSTAGTEYTIGEKDDIKLTLRRKPDGRWLFDQKTLLDLPRMRLFLWQRDLAAGRGKETGDVPADFRSPYAMYHTFMDSFRSGDLDGAARCLDLTDVPDPARRIVGRELAFKLREVLNRAIFVIFQDLPDTSVGTPLSALVHKEGRITAERQAEGPRKGQWLFNRATVRSIDRLYAAYESRPLVPELAENGREAAGPQFGEAPGLWVRQRVPSALMLRVRPVGRFSLALYQILGIVLAVAVAIPIGRVVVAVLVPPAMALTRRRGVAAEEAEARDWARPIGWLAVAWVLVEAVTILDLPMDVAGALLAVLVPAFWLVGAFAVYRLIQPIMLLVAGPAATQEGATTLAAMGFPVISLVLKILVIVCGLAAILSLFDFDVATVVAGLGIGGLAVALAAQDTLKNFFGSLMLIADRTFRVGDLVQIAGNEGVVESVGLRTTRIRCLDDALMTIPNSDLTTSHVTNFGARRFRRFRTRITVAHGTSPGLLVRLRDGILGLIRGREGVRQQKYEVAVNDLAAPGIEVLIQVFFDVPDAHAELTARDGLILDILRLAEDLGISFDSPAMVLEREPHPAGPAFEGAPATPAGR